MEDCMPIQIANGTSVKAASMESTSDMKHIVTLSVWSLGSTVGVPYLMVEISPNGVDSWLPAFKQRRHAHDNNTWNRQTS